MGQRRPRPASLNHWRPRIPTFSDMSHTAKCRAWLVRRQATNHISNVKAPSSQHHPLDGDRRVNDLSKLLDRSVSESIMFPNECRTLMCPIHSLAATSTLPLSTRSLQCLQHTHCTSPVPRSTLDHIYARGFSSIIMSTRATGFGKPLPQSPRRSLPALPPSLPRSQLNATECRMPVSCLLHDPGRLCCRSERTCSPLLRAA